MLNYFNLKCGKHLESEAEARYMQIRNKELVCNIVNIQTLGQATKDLMHPVVSKSLLDIFLRCTLYPNRSYA